MDMSRKTFRTTKEVWFDTQVFDNKAQGRKDRTIETLHVVPYAAFRIDTSIKAACSSTGISRDLMGMTVLLDTVTACCPKIVPCRGVMVQKTSIMIEPVMKTGQCLCFQALIGTKAKNSNG